MPETRRIYIGFDPRQAVSFTALVSSILVNAARPVAISPLVLETLPIKRTGLTPFTFSRFLVPWLCGFEGWALFLDCDQMLRADIGELLDWADDDYAVMVAELEPAYRFERAAVMLLNCGHPDNKALTPDLVDDPARCARPHLIDWTDRIGFFPPVWHHLVGYHPPRADAKLVHFTQGVPCFPETRGCEHGAEWWRYSAFANSTQPWAALMGNSVHARTLADGRLAPKLRTPAVAQ